MSAQNPKFLFLTPKRQVDKNILKKDVSPECFSGQIDFSSDGPGLNYFSSESEKNSNVLNFIKKLLRIITWTRENGFRKHQILSQNVPKTYRAGIVAGWSTIVFLENFSYFVLVPCLKHRRRKRSRRCCASFILL